MAAIVKIKSVSTRSRCWRAQTCPKPKRRAKIDALQKLCVYSEKWKCKKGIQVITRRPVASLRSTFAVLFLTCDSKAQNVNLTITI